MFASHATRAMIYFVSLALFMQQGCRTERYQNHLVGPGRHKLYFFIVKQMFCDVCLIFQQCSAVFAYSFFMGFYLARFCSVVHYRVNSYGNKTNKTCIHFGTVSTRANDLLRTEYLTLYFLYFIV